MVKSIPNKSERGGNIFDFIGMAKEVTVKRELGINQNVDYLDYMNVVPKLNKPLLGEAYGPA
tara:strand:+ start:117 stop:302 length:186 start_codon:yes stop_codon:yes gene_type:complete